MTAPNQPATTISDGSDRVDVDLVLELLSDEYACEILRALDEASMDAQELVQRCEMSRPTVYRRLETMSEAGIIESRQSSTPAGQQRTVYQLTVAAVEFEVDSDGVAGAVRPSKTNA